MKSETMFKIVIVFLIILSVTGSVLFITQDYGDPHPAIDAVERSLETSRHERLLASIAQSDATMSDFTTDGCSGGLSIGWEQFAVSFTEFAIRHGDLPPWQECCVIHDRQYHAGSAGLLSASESFERRKQADLALKTCVVDTGVRRSAALQDIYGLTEAQVRDFYVAISELMYRAVRVGGIPCTDQPWRWGYGWPRCSQDSKI